MAKVLETVRAGLKLPPVRRQIRRLFVLKSADASAVGRTYHLEGGTLVLGRVVEGRGQIEDSSISREHVRVVPGAAGHVIEDLGSTNGTYLNGRRLGRAPADLMGGDVLLLGHDTLLVVDEEPEPDHLPTAPDVKGDSVVEHLGCSLASERIRRSLETVARAKGPVLLLGETGTGKEIAARAIHRLDTKKGAPFVAVDCGRLPADAADSQLFGHRRGVFPSALSDHDGYFQQANGGTLFLDEIANLPPNLQPKLLRALEEGSIEPAGGGEARRVELRVVAATNTDLKASAFRPDLLARMSNWVLRLPPLTKRRADVLLLWDHFFALEGRRARPLSSACAEALLLYGWPMNVRELRHLASRTAALAGDRELIDLDLLPEELQRPIRARHSPGEAREAAEPEAGEPAGDDASAPDRATLEAALRKVGGNVKLAAEQNRWNKTLLYRWIRKFGLNPVDYR
jgi:DNA-binding NtrC family response regulator